MLRQPGQLKNSNIWEQASKIKKKDQSLYNQEKILIIVGQQGSGKTSFIKIIRGDLDFETKPTYLLDYTYIKRLAVKKQLLHCYQIATKSLTEVISSLITKDNYMDVYLVICVDIAKPGNLIDTTLEWINLLRKQIQIFLKQKLINRQQRYRQFVAQLQSSLYQSEDKTNIIPMPLRTMIVGCKYDHFERFDTENRKWISRCLRYIAHVNNCSLYYCSAKNMQVGAQLRNIISEEFFGEKKSQYTGQKEHTKPIFIRNGQDSISSMNLPSSGGSLGTIQILKKQMSSLFSNEQQKKKDGIDYSKYYQSKIDSLIQQKKKVNLSNIQELNKIAKKNGQGYSMKKII